MVVESIDKKKITISFSGSVGKRGLNSIKKYIQAIEEGGDEPKKVPQRLINKLAVEINKSAWEKLKKKRNLGDR